MDLDQRDAVHGAARQHQIAVGSRHHVTDDAAARRDHPGLEAIAIGVAPHQCVVAHTRFALPDRVSDGHDPSVGAIHSVSVTSAGLASTTASGYSRSGKFAARYVDMTWSWSVGGAIIERMRSSQPARSYPAEFAI